MQERWIQPLGQKDDLEKEMATHSSILRMSKTRNLFKKIKDTKGTFHAKIGTIKERNAMDLTKAEDIKKRWQTYTENSIKRVLMTQIITMVWLLIYSQTTWGVKSSGP